MTTEKAIKRLEDLKFGLNSIDTALYGEALEMAIEALSESNGDCYGTGGQTKKCKECPHFKIMYEPLRSPGALWDMGRARCEKYNLVIDFANHGKLNKLTCQAKEVTA